MIARLAVLLLVAAAACGSSSKPATPDTALGTPDASPDAPSAPDARPLTVIGVGATACQGHSDPAKAFDIGPVIPDEIGDPAIARITPPSYPFKVEKIAYQLTGMKDSCATNIAHTVVVFAAPTGDAPPASPTDVQRIDVAAPSADQGTLVIEQTLATPITLTTGQDLYVGIEMAVNANKTLSTCLDGCTLTADDKRQFWSEAPKTPYTWATLYSFGISADYAIWAEGAPQ